ncbi:MAG: methyltransferase domain-containing protein [Geobacteraceae bacterium]|nr:methyltransferase domain-containing protein [Geobacteraceae bacterium]
MAGMPRVVAELGPGDSLGIGLAALLSGSERYQAFDVVRFALHGHNIRMLEELAGLFRRQAAIPDDTEFPNLFPRLDNYDFPLEVLGGAILNEAVLETRATAVRHALEEMEKGRNPGEISYSVPWNTRAALDEESVDLIISQAVLEHVDALGEAYVAMYRWLRQGGFISHEIDFKSHGTAKEWNGHWGYGALLWRIIRGNRTYLLNREPCSIHLKNIEAAGFALKYLQREPIAGGIPIQGLYRDYRGLPADDLITGSAYVLACKEIT